MSGEYFVLIESNTTGTGRLFVKAAAAEGFTPIVLAADVGRYPYLQSDAVEARVVNTSSVGALRAACRELERRAPIAGVTTSSEYFIEPTSRLASSLGLRGPDPAAVRSTRNKATQRARLAAAGVSSPRFRRVSSATAARKAAAELGCPVVVKPVRGTGSVGVRRCSTPAAAATHAAALLAERVNERGQPTPRCLLVEEEVIGPEYSIETFNAQIVGVTAKYLGEPPSFVEVGHDFPAVLAQAERLALERIACDALSALGLQWGPAHVEARLTRTGPQVIEVNPRLAGGYIPELVRQAMGIDLVALTVKLAAGRVALLQPRRRRHSSIRFLLAGRDGVFVGVDAGPAPPGARFEVYRRSGERVQSRGDFRDRVGHVLTVAADAAGAREAADAAKGRATILIGNMTRGASPCG